MLRCVSLRVLAGSCSLSPPSGGASARPCPLRRCAARSRAFAVLRPLRRPRVPFRGGALPPAPLPRRRAAARAPPRAAALRSGRGRPRAARARLCSCPLRGLRPPLWSLRSLRGVLAPLLPRRAAAFGGVAVRPRGGGAVLPSAPCSRVSPPSGASPRRFRSASPPPCQRAAAAACGGRAAAGGLLAAAAAAAFCGALRPPARGLGFAPLRRRFFRGCCGALLRRVARLPCLRLRLPSHAVGRATAARPDCAFGAFVVQGENRMQGATASTTYCADYSLDIPHTGEFGKTRIILPNYLWISSIDTAPHF